MLFEINKSDIAGDHVRSTIQALVDKLQHKKEELVILAFEKHTGEKYVLEEELKYRFRRVMVEIDQVNGHEHYYYNDGTKEGLRLISFVNKQPDWFNEKEPYRITSGFTHY